MAYQIDGDDKQNRIKGNFHRRLKQVEVKSSNIIKFRLPCKFLRFSYQTLCVLYQIKDRKYVEQNFHSVAEVMPQGLDLGVPGVKIFSVGFAMAPYRLRVLVPKVASIHQSVPFIFGQLFPFSAENMFKE